MTLGRHTNVTFKCNDFINFLWLTVFFFINIMPFTIFSYLFHVMVENGMIFMCASDTELGRRQPYAYLTEVKKLCRIYRVTYCAAGCEFLFLCKRHILQIKRRFQSSSLHTRAQFAHEGEFDRDFSQVMAGQMVCPLIFTCYLKKVKMTWLFLRILVSLGTKQVNSKDNFFLFDTAECHVQSEL